MNELLQKIENFKKQKFNGDLKIGIEYGRCCSVGVANKFDVPVSELDKVHGPDTFLKSIKNDFFGSIIYRFVNGEIKEYSFSQSFKGDSLHKYLKE